MHGGPNKQTQQQKLKNKGNHELSLLDAIDQFRSLRGHKNQHFADSDKFTKPARKFPLLMNVLWLHRNSPCTWAEQLVNLLRGEQSDEGLQCNDTDDEEEKRAHDPKPPKHLLLLLLWLSQLLPPSPLLTFPQTLPSAL